MQWSQYFKMVKILSMHLQPQIVHPCSIWYTCTNLIIRVSFWNASHLTKKVPIEITIHIINCQLVLTLITDNTLNAVVHYAIKHSWIYENKGCCKLQNNEYRMKVKIHVELFMRQQQRGFDELCCIYCVSV